MTTPATARARPVGVILRRVAGTLVVLALLAWVLRRAWLEARAIDWASLQVRPGLIAVSVLLIVVGLFWQGVLWVLMMRGLGYRLPMVAGTRAGVVSLVGNYVPGKLLILVFRAGLVRRYGVPGVPVASSVVLETILRNIVAAILAVVGLWWLGVGNSYLPMLVLVLVVSVVVVHPAVFNPLTDFLLRRLGRPPLPRRLRVRQIIGLTAGFVPFWALYAGGLFLMARGTLGATTADAPGLTVALLVSMIFSTLAVFAPVGLGVADATLAGILTLTGMASGAGVLAVVARVWRTLAEMLAAGLAWVLPAGAGAAEDAVADDACEAADGDAGAAGGVGAEP